ncbi:hypothetical protein GJ496_000292 [Pomphorhynchus laevis]|nr:hypothetical protein GJ496_000292 [Pomphorhynchus laevis]
MVSKSYSTKENDNMKMEIYARKMINTNSTDNTQQHLCSASFLTATFKKNKCPIIEKLLNDNPMNMDPTEQDFANLVKLIKACSLNMEIVNDVTTESVEQSASVVKHCVAISISTEPVITSQAMENSLKDRRLKLNNNLQCDLNKWKRLCKTHDS